MHGVATYARVCFTLSWLTTNATITRHGASPTEFVGNFRQG